MTTVKILVVEDEGIIALDIQNQLEEIGYAATAIAASGEEAVRKAAEFSPDLVLMDINLRGKMDGVEAASLIQTHLNIPIVYLTAQTDENTFLRARLTEPRGYLLKPFEPQDLSTAIKITLTDTRFGSKHDCSH